MKAKERQIEKLWQGCQEEKNYWLVVWPRDHATLNEGIQSSLIITYYYLPLIFGKIEFYVILEGNNLIRLQTFMQVHNYL